MEIRFWGVRGSIASPGPDTSAVGGNTSCVEARFGSTRIVLDAGTGLRALGDRLAREAKDDPRALDVNVLLSHQHWDHIQGLPFFAPTYMPDARITVRGAANGVEGLRETLAGQMRAPVFPVRLDDVGAELRIEEVREGRPFAIDDVVVRAAKLHHPGGVLAYRLDGGGRSVVYATDTEHPACLDPALLALARGADLLIYDAQYTDEEYRGETGPPRVGWGHSTYRVGTEIARAAGVSTLVLFHHDPRRTDAQVEVIEARARELFEASVAAREGMTIKLSERTAHAA